MGSGFFLSPRMCAVRVSAAVLLGVFLGVLAPVCAGPWMTGPFVRREPEITEASLVWQKVFTLS